MDCCKQACKREAEYECNACGERYCEDCAFDEDFECPCCEPPRLYPIPKIKLKS